LQSRCGSFCVFALLKLQFEFQPSSRTRSTQHTHSTCFDGLLRVS
jgi:hypothetical protein